MSNPEFLDEHDGLFSGNRKHLLRVGIPQPVTAMPIASQARQGAPGRSEKEPFILDFRDFCQRWRLQTLVGPYLPVPIEPRIPDLPSGPEKLPATKGSTTISLPDIFPVSGRGELQSAVDDAVHGGEKPIHLAGWSAIINAANPAKNQIHRCVRLFRFQHFVRALFSRHSEARFYRKRQKLREALAAFFKVNDDTIKADWKYLDDRIGKDWHLRNDPQA